MKEFIEKLIGRLEEVSYNRFDLKLSDAIKVVNQLAEEYNNDFCEWRKGKGLYLHRTSCGAQDSYDDSYRYCPYCGKKVKVIKNGQSVR